MFPSKSRQIMGWSTNSNFVGLFTTVPVINPNPQAFPYGVLVRVQCSHPGRARGETVIPYRYKCSIRLWRTVREDPLSERQATAIAMFLVLLSSGYFAAASVRRKFRRWDWCNIDYESCERFKLTNAADEMRVHTTWTCWCIGIWTNFKDTIRGGFWILQFEQCYYSLFSPKSTHQWWPHAVPVPIKAHCGSPWQTSPSIPQVVWVVASNSTWQNCWITQDTLSQRNYSCRVPSRHQVMSMARISTIGLGVTCFKLAYQSDCLSMPITG